MRDNIFMNIPTLISFLALSLVSCKKEELGDCGFKVSYAADIRPIIESSCKTQAGPGTGCHDSWIDDYNQIKNYIDNNKLPTRVLHETSMPKMPNDWNIDSLSSSEKEVIECWIDQGYKKK